MTLYRQLAVRALETSDLDPVAKLWHESWKSTGMEVAQRGDEAGARPRIRRGLDTWDAYVACAGTDTVGFLALIMEENSMDQLFIAPRHQRRGVGRLLLNFTKRKLPNGFWVPTWSDNLGACAFYDAEGLLRVKMEHHPSRSIPLVVYKWEPWGRRATIPGSLQFIP